MQLGSHFGKRKPRWNFFLDQHRLIKQRHGLTLKFVLFGVITQALILAPLMYWSLQNYNFFAENIPLSYNLKGYLSTEKNWITFLYFFSLAFTGAVNFSLFSKAFDKALNSSSVSETSPDESANQRHAS